MRQSPDQTRPEYRSLQIFAIDPLVARGGDHQTTVQVRFEPLAPTATPGGITPVSFKGQRVEIVDVDTSSDPPVWLKPVNLDDPFIAMTHGLEPSEADPQFHHQMVYAVAMRTFEQFDRALGRVVYLRRRRRLRLVPHAFQGSNAFYHPQLLAVLFGYFRAREDMPGENLPGQLIFTCLSHDIIAHEVTHAIVDRLRPYFNVATNPHVRAFHEAFADIVAVFQRLTYRDLVHRALQESQGSIEQNKRLSDIATQFGHGLGSSALRSALNPTTRIQDVHEEHDLGAVLVAAIFDAFSKTYQRRTADLVRIATGGTGNLPDGNLHPDLVARLTDECVRTAQSVLTMCIRAFDYLPPADVTFGNFLRALVTADWELNPQDVFGLRAAVIEACRVRGIFAIDAGSLAVNALLLKHAPPEDWGAHEGTFRSWVDLGIRYGVDEQRDEAPEEDDPLPNPDHARQAYQGPPVASEPDYGEEPLDSASQLRASIEAWFRQLSAEERARLGMLPQSVTSDVRFHVHQRVASDGTLRFGLVVQLIEKRAAMVAGKAYTIPSGATLIIDVTGRVRFVVRSAPPDTRVVDLERVAAGTAVTALGWTSLEPANANPFAVDYRGMHEGRT